MSPHLAKMGRKLAAWRELRGWTQAHAAAQLGVQQPAWAAWEIGRNAPDLGNAMKLERLTEGQIPAEGWVRTAKHRRRRRPPHALRPTGSD